MQAWSKIAIAAAASSVLACSPAEQREAREEIGTAGQKVEAALEDSAVTAAVKTKLLADTTVSGMSIDVDTSNGVVTLSGRVDSTAAQGRAVELARSTNGAQQVIDHLTVSQP
ncbi:MAG: BON domain-containing protein [Vicinamibacterales bacterium]